MHWHAAAPPALGAFGVFRMQGPCAGGGLQCEHRHVCVDPRSPALRAKSDTQAAAGPYYPRGLRSKGPYAERSPVGRRKRRHPPGKVDADPCPCWIARPYSALKTPHCPQHRRFRTVGHLACIAAAANLTAQLWRPALNYLESRRCDQHQQATGRNLLGGTRGLGSAIGGTGIPRR